MNAAVQRRALVTGGSGDIGAAICRALSAQGLHVIVHAHRNRERADDLVHELQASGASAQAVAFDLADAAAVNAALQPLLAQGAIDVLVNNAGIGTAVPASREAPEDFRRVIDVNLNGCYWMAQACGAVMQPGSSIVNISSVLGLTTAGLPQAAYSASKAGLIGLTRDLAQQWTGRKGIRVNALAPGFFASEMTEQYPEGYLETTLARAAVGRAGDPRELAAALVFLASDAGGYTTGQTLAVDGGVSIT
jgi:NAD(P)-dependent dehydrogenase (short-subunit alcohol dehydrogenase family)